jgi:hypothetical protein
VYSRPSISTRSGAEAGTAEAGRQHLQALPHPTKATSTAQPARALPTIVLFIAPL